MKILPDDPDGMDDEKSKEKELDNMLDDVAD